MILKCLLLPLLVLTTWQKSRSQNSPKNYSCMFYNVENLFHPSDEPCTSDDDFTPEGERRWTYYRYNKKISEICKVILAVNGWDPPSIICLSEIENLRVLEDIVYHPLLINHNYGILHRDSPDQRGMDVAILYRTDRAQCIDTTWITVKDKAGQSLHTRDILTAKFILDRGTLLVAANHWTSKYGGAPETEDKRILLAGILGNYIDSVLRYQPGIHVIAGGDLNDLPGSAPLRVLENDFRLHHILPSSGQSSYKYRGKWGSVDHLFVAGQLLPENCSAFIPQLPFLLEKDEKYTGERPKRTYRGYAYSGGISDHLPLLLVFELQD